MVDYKSKFFYCSLQSFNVGIEEKNFQATSQTINKSQYIILEESYKIGENYQRSDNIN